MTSQCPKCSKSKPVMWVENATVTYYYCESCDTGWSVDRRDPQAALPTASTQRTTRR